MSYPDNTGWTIKSVGADMWTNGFGDGQSDAVATITHTDGRSLQFVQAFEVNFEHAWNGETNDSHGDMSLDEADDTYNEIMAEAEEGDEIKRGYWLYTTHETWDVTTAEGEVRQGELSEPADMSWWRNLDFDGPAGGKEFDAVVEDTIKAVTKNNAERILIFCDMEEVYEDALADSQLV